ncbi:GNAT family N-acetyltransferase [Micromonospora phytophila]|uniref:GNAT family N-acetyltransferase n=1 Tax=Micromonospora phytophila TaxID=709888 RepID=UPI00202E3777|nr:GNAT family N-acetyltransferase [Micromonospora phytophila]MCM0674365.1 GNAT family N-acetyltransferase [Micromonospora phytophila]
MIEVTVRPMSREEFDRWQTDVVDAYAQEQVAAGNWTADEALGRSQEANAALLPQGMATPGMIFLLGVLADGTPIGRLWIGLAHPRGVAHCAYLYDIEVVAERRGQGLGRVLLAAGERVAQERGAHALELNVFGSNTPALSLYGSAGYRVMTQQMRKGLRTSAQPERITR